MLRVYSHVCLGVKSKQAQEENQRVKSARVLDASRGPVQGRKAADSMRHVSQVADSRHRQDIYIKKR